LVNVIVLSSGAFWENGVGAKFFPVDSNGKQAMAQSSCLL
jgi:hypothetical protein